MVAVPTRLGQRISRDEMMVATLQVWPAAVIEEALGDDLAAVLPEVLTLAGDQPPHVGGVAIPRLPDGSMQARQHGRSAGQRREQIGAGLHGVSGDPGVVARQRSPFSPESSGNPPKSIGCDERHG
jgi:hypothetical protein